MPVRLPRLSLRGRAALMAVFVTAVVLFASATLVLAVHRNQLITALDQTLELQVADRVRLLEAGSPPESLTTALQDESLVWIGTADGTTLAQGGQLRALDSSSLAQSLNTTGDVELSVEEAHRHEEDEEEAPDPGERDEDDGSEEDDEDDEDDELQPDAPVEPVVLELELTKLRIASGSTSSGSNGSLLVVAGAESESIDNAIASLIKIFAVALIPLSITSAALAWFLTGRVLRPVEMMRGRAEDIGGTTLDERVPIPDGKDEVHALAITMNSMLDRIESHDRSLRQFTADASHELKSPVANVRALVETSSLQGMEWDDLKGTLIGETDRLAGLVENLLYLALDDAGSPAPAAHTVDLDELVFSEAAVVASSRDISIDLNGVQPAAVHGSALELGQLVRNLLDNAARHARGRVKIQIESSPQPVLSIGDDGAGIDETDRTRVFERFTRLDDSRSRDAGGSGLGLAIVQRIATRHDATVEIGDSPLGGAEVVVRFRE